jgi:hypothetical protein
MLASTRVADVDRNAAPALFDPPVAMFWPASRLRQALLGPKTMMWIDRHLRRFGRPL